MFGCLYFFKISPAFKSNKVVKKPDVYYIQNRKMVYVCFRKRLRELALSSREIEFIYVLCRDIYIYMYILHSIRFAFLIIY